MQTFPTTTASPSHPHAHPTYPPPPSARNWRARLSVPAGGLTTLTHRRPAAQPPFDLMFKHGGNERGACASNYDNDVSSPSADLQLFFRPFFSVFLKHPSRRWLLFQIRDGSAAAGTPRLVRGAWYVVGSFPGLPFFWRNFLSSSFWRGLFGSSNSGV